MRSETELISVEKGDSLQQMERHLLSAQKCETRVDVRVPQQMAYGGTLGIMPALLQFIGTWSRLKKSGRLRFYGPIEIEPGINRFLNTPPGLVAAYMAPGFNNPSVDRTSLLRHAAPTVDAMHAGELKSTYKGQGVFLACFSGARNEYLIPLYKRADTQGLRGTADFFKLTRQIVETCDRKFLSTISTDALQDISSVLRELIENTNDHATTDESGVPYSWDYPSVRGLIARKTRIDAKGRKDVFRGDSRSSFSYLHALLNSDDSNVDLLELAVFDFGPGIAKRWLAFENREPSLGAIDFAEEEQVVRSAFELGRSSKREGGTGVGLDSVVRSFSRLKAFVRLRTGRMCLRQDFRGGAQKFAPKHENPDSPILSEAVGTTFSIMIPLSLR